MAINMLIQYMNGSRNTPPSPAHDLESLIYVFTWICVVYSCPGQVCSDVSLQETCVKRWTSIKTLQDVETLCNARTGELSTKSFLNYFTPYFKQLKGTVSALYNLLCTSCTPDGPPLTHGAMKVILLQAFLAVPEPSFDVRIDNVPAKCPVNMHVTEGNNSRPSRQCCIG